nr:unnamed protein product [Digitaria exilis]
MTDRRAKMLPATRTHLNRRESNGRRKKKKKNAPPHPPPLLGASAAAAGLPIGLLRRRAPLQGSSEEKNAQLATWNASTPLCLWRGLRWSTTAGARANLSLTGDPTILLVSPRPRSPGHSRRSSGPSPRWRPSTYLSANSLTGAVPLELGNAPALTALDLSRNRLSGALPASLCDHGVTELRLHGNALTGAIPEPAAPNTTCDALRGHIPEALAHIQALNLSYNSFSGQLPAASLATSSPDSFVGNVCGPPLRQPCVSSSSGLSSRHAVVLASVSIGQGHHNLVQLRAFYQGRRTREHARCTTSSCTRILI